MAFRGEVTLPDVQLISRNNDALFHARRDTGGVPRVFEVAGVSLVKCLVCDGPSELPLVICSDCSMAVAVVREIGSDTLQALGRAIVQHGFLELLDLVAEKGLKEWMERELKSM